MPSRPNRCAGVRGGVRCRRNGTGQPPLCRDCRILMLEVQAAAAGHNTTGSPLGFIDRISEVVGEFFATGRVSRVTVERATSETMRTILQGAGQGAGQAQPRPQPHQRAGWLPPKWPPPRPPGWRGPWPPQNAQQGASRPPQVSEDELAQRRARKVLGFGPTEKLTEDAIKERRRQLALRVHPDRGGSAEKMADVNNSADVLLSAVS